MFRLLPEEVVYHEIRGRAVRAMVEFQASDRLGRDQKLEAARHYLAISNELVAEIGV